MSLMPASECTQRGGHPRGSSCHTVPDITFFSLLLFLTTFLSTTALQHVRSSRFFSSKVRHTALLWERMEGGAQPTGKGGRKGAART